MRRSSARRLAAAVTAATVACVVVVAGAGAAAGPPFATVAQTEALILNSQFGDSNAVTDVACVGLKDPKPKTNGAGQQTFHRFRCTLESSYFENLVTTVVLTGNGGFNLTPAK
jgi:hypothetical protein